ncbi:DUF6355 family natural product biosynthesis protein [Streptomyces sp. NPDC018059]|uniref:DUF6355 family natural product biosynthesis protein n=1 Tax=Streptomyces sp. NPDC018059 TaxID=3365041 RepID=UPI0037A072CE
MAVTATPAAAAPCGFYETSTDAYYNHCTSDGSRVVIQVRVALAPTTSAASAPVRPGWARTRKSRVRTTSAAPADNRPSARGHWRVAPCAARLATPRAQAATVRFTDRL